MAASGRITGKDVFVSFGGTALSGDVTSVKIDEGADLVDVTAGADTDHYKIVARNGENTVDLEAFRDGSTTTVWTAIAPGNAGTLIVAPEGTASGKTKWTWSRAVVEKRGAESPFDDAQTISASFAISSAKTEGTY